MALSCRDHTCSDDSALPHILLTTPATSLCKCTAFSGSADRAKTSSFSSDLSEASCVRVVASDTRARKSSATRLEEVPVGSGGNDNSGDGQG